MPTLRSIAILCFFSQSAIFSVSCRPDVGSSNSGSEVSGTLRDDWSRAKNARLGALRAASTEGVIQGLLQALDMFQPRAALTPLIILTVPGTQTTVRALNPDRMPGGYSGRTPFAQQARLSNGSRPNGWASHGRFTTKFNCHGFVFLGGAGTLPGAEVQRILDSGVYTQVNENSLRVGDVAVYYTQGSVEHTAIVVKPAGRQSRLLSKWGPYEMYDHDADVILESYGTNIRYYRNESNKSHFMDVRLP